MRFRELRIEASDQVSDHGRVPTGFTFRWTTHHVREIFAALLPQPYVLDGSSVVQITCGPRGEKPQYTQSPLGSSEFFIEDFDFGAYFRASPAERERYIIVKIEAALCDIAGRSCADPEPIHSTAASMVAAGFRHTVEVAKLRKRIRTTGSSIRVFRSLGQEIGETWYLRVMDCDGQDLAETVMGKTPDYLDRRGYFHSAVLDGDEYIVRDRLEKITFRHDVSQFSE